jgi:nucleoside-diphosphate-sugar epimerase
MTRVGVIGANGQVGAELCLLLEGRPGIDLVPICRTRSGSAFLRWQGLACRHGRVSDPADAARLMGDCEVIVNSSLASGSPASILNTEDAIIRSAFEHSGAAATIIHFSTQSVYGDPAAGRLLRWRNPYGRAKHATEREVHRQSRRCRKPAFILRLGHVCGTMQEISESIRRDLRQNAVTLPHEDCSSNTVYVAAIAGAIEQIVRGGVAPGTYDLMNHPRWTWRQVYEYEARSQGCEFEPKIASASRKREHGRLLAIVMRVLGRLAVAGPIRNLAAAGFARLPQDINARAMAWWYARRARSEISQLQPAIEAPEHLSWVENGRRFLPAQTPTLELLEEYGMPAGKHPGRVSWPPDLPDATPSRQTADGHIAFTSRR